MTDLSTRADELLAAHHGERPLVLPNVWDVSSARAVEEAGFPVVATSSRAIANVLGIADDDSSDPDLIFGHVGRISGALSCPVTADLEAAFGLTPSELVDRMLAVGVVGCNLEDSDHHGTGVLVDSGQQATFLSQVRSAANAKGVHVVINARVDCFIRHLGNDEEQLAEGIRRARLYFEAGADCVYPIALVDRERIAQFVSAMPGPVNVQARRDTPDLNELAQMGVRRVSLASGLFNLTYDYLRSSLGNLAKDGLAALWQEASKSH